MNTMDLLYEFTDRSGRKKTIKTYCGDICDITNDIDVVICSAFKRAYAPTPRTLIGTLWNKKGISVHYLAQEPDLDLRMLGGWLSKELTGNFKRIACIELVDWSDRENFAYQRSVTIATAFTTMRFLLEQSANRGISVRRVVVPLLGGGRQNIEPCYLVVPLIKECLASMENISELQEIIFCDINAERIFELKQAAYKLNLSIARPSPIFISYNTLDFSHAQIIRSALTHREIDCWMAPESIPVGSSYIEEIPSALNNASAVALILSSNTELSNWVQKELAVAISRNCPIFPFQIGEYAMGPAFSFLLADCQIFREWDTPQAQRYQHYVDRLTAQLHI